MALRRRAATAIALLFISVPGCVRRSGRNPDCKWPGEPNVQTLHPNQRGYARQLRGDVEFAQELAVEYVGAHYGAPQRAATQALNACLNTLIVQIAKSHNVPPREVAKFFGRRRLAVDVVVTAPFVLIYIFLAGVLVGKLRGRYPPDDGWTVPLAMIILSSLAVGMGGMLLGEQWATLVEGIRVGTGHPSTMGVSRDRLLCFLCRTVLGCCRRPVLYATAAPRY